MNRVAMKMAISRIEASGLNAREQDKLLCLLIRRATYAEVIEHVNSTILQPKDDLLRGIIQMYYPMGIAGTSGKLCKNRFCC